MGNVEVLLRDRVENLGHCGDVVKVATGYARNYLFPRSLAVPATDENKRMMVRRAKRLAVEDAVLQADVEKRVAALAVLTLTTVEKTDENGHLYGSVSAARVAEILSAAGYPCHERDVRLERPIKAAGSHRVPVHVHAETFEEFTLVVEARS